MKKYILSKAVILFFTLLTLFSCSIINKNETIKGEGQVTVKTINLSSFTDIHLENYCDVEIVEGSEFKVEFSDYQNIVDLLDFKIVDNKLIIKPKKLNLNVNNSKAKAIIYVPGNIKNIAIAGSGNILLKKQINNIENLAISGSGDIKSEVESKSDNLSIAISGSGDIDFSKVESQNVNCSISGSGEIKVNAVKSLKIAISGSGDVYYKGNPSVSSKINGSGEVVKM